MSGPIGKAERITKIEFEARRREAIKARAKTALSDGPYPPSYVELFECAKDVPGLLNENKQLRSLLKETLAPLNSYEDAGSYDEGWKSEELVALISKIEKEVEAL